MKLTNDEIKHFSPLEHRLLEIGFEPLRKTKTPDFLFRRFFSFQELQEIFRARMLREGAQKGSHVSVVYSRSDDIVSIYVNEPGLLIEFIGDKKAVGLWSAGVEAEIH